MVRPQRLTVENPQVLRFGDKVGMAAGVPPGTNVYRNDIDLELASFYAPGAGQQMADDLELVAGGCDLVYYNLAVFGDGTAGFTFDVHTELWDGDPCDSPRSQVIEGTQRDFLDVPNDNATISLLEASLDASPVAIPGAIWLAATFSVDGAGWIMAEDAEVGETLDLWSEDDTDLVPPRCAFLWFGGPPEPYGGFWANINCNIGGDPLGACCDGTTCTQATEGECIGGTWQGAFTMCDPNPCQSGACCTGAEFTACFDTTEAGCSGDDQLFHPDALCDESPCLPAFKVYENDFLTRIFDTIDAGTIWADDLRFEPGPPCELLAYDIAMVGIAETANFNAHVGLWSNNDGGTPLDEEDDIPLAPIAGTTGDFNGITADFFAHTLLAGPFDGVILPEKVWLVFSTSSDQAGPLTSGLANIGSSRDAFAIFNFNNSGEWTGNFWYGGFDPTDCPGGDNCNPAGSFDITVWCAGDEPTGACCNDAAGTCVDGVRRLQCEGRWAVNVTCASAPFDPACGTNACCTQFGCTDTTRATCDTFSGSIIPNLFCDDFDRICPRNECLGAEGSCREAHGTPGCEDAFCCAAVCAIDQRCCTLEWDAVCVTQAGRECGPPAPPNDHCDNAEIIVGTGEFNFDNGTATTDGPLHEACLDLGEETHITDDVWYCWTAPCTDTVYVRTCELTEVDTKIAVYDGCDACPPEDAALLGCNDDFCGFDLGGRQSQVSFSATQGRSYLIRIGSFPGAPGGIGGLSISCGLPDQAVCAPGAGVCCTDTNTPGCNDELCCETVCACDPRCCEVEWTADCGGTGFGDSGCGAELLCGNLCVPVNCPDGEVTWLSPPDGVVDARQPHPPGDAGQALGIDRIRVEAPSGANLNECWELCETGDTGSANSVVNVVNNLDGSLTLQLARPITTDEVTTLTYLGSGSWAAFTSHPGNVNGDDLADGADISSFVECLLGGGSCTQWQCDADHSGQCGPADLLRLIDILNGAEQFEPWINSPLPTPGGCP